MPPKYLTASHEPSIGFNGVSPSGRHLDLRLGPSPCNHHNSAKKVGALQNGSHWHAWSCVPRVCCLVLFSLVWPPAWLGLRNNKSSQQCSLALYFFRSLDPVSLTIYCNFHMFLTFFAKFASNLCPTSGLSISLLSEVCESLLRCPLARHHRSCRPHRLRTCSLREAKPNFLCRPTSPPLK